MIPVTITLALSTETLLLGHELVAALRGVAEAMRGAHPLPVTEGVAQTAPLPSSPPPEAAQETRPGPVTPAPEAIGASGVPPQLAPAAASVPPAAFSPAPANRVWTEERKDILRRDWPAGVPVDEIRRRIEACPGPEAPSTATIGVYAASSLRLKRPAGFRTGHKPTAAAIIAPTRPVAEYSVAARMLADDIAANSGAVAIDWRGARTWGARNGAPMGGTEAQTLAAVNARRVELGLPPYRIITAVGPSEALPDARLGGATL